MNERILALYKQAQIPYTAKDPSNNMSYETTCFSAEKFAELIVQECINLADEFELEVNRSGLVDRIRYHFGIES